jgi:hypothetical protein
VDPDNLSAFAPEKKLEGDETNQHC